MVFRCVRVFVFGAGGFRGDPKEQSKVGQEGTSTPLTVFLSFLVVVFGFFPHAKGG